jgi:hypothetical protein
MNNESTDNEIYLTFDVDWAPDEVMAPLVEMLKEANLKATFFATHASELLAGLSEDQFEIGLHPNFNHANGNFKEPIQTLKGHYPQARGGRSHSLFVSSHILQLYIDHGLKYESNIFMPLHEGLHPVLRFEDFISIPFYWSDDKHLSLKTPFEIEELGLETRGMKVLNFHPMHVFMNTLSDEHYASYKAHYQNPSRLKDFVNRESKGMGTLFRSVLDYLKSAGAHTDTLYSVYQNYISTHEQSHR